ncbi:MAG: phage tail length tape measure family protein [Sandaracinobacter sp.]
MTIQLDAEFTVRAGDANATLKQSAAALSDLKVKELEASAAARQASQALRELERQQAKTGDTSLELAERLRQQRVAAADTAIQLTQAQRAVANFGKANDLAAAGVGRQRAAYQQLGFQISDVAAQAAVGTNPMIIFAQQGGQIAQALAGAGGVLGRVAGFLAGPWGAAVLGAGAVLGVLVSELDGAGNAADEMADRYGEAGQRVADTFVSPLVEAAGSLKDAFLADIKKLVDGTVQDLDRLARAGQWTADFLNRLKTGGGLSALASGGSLLGPSELERVRQAEAEQAARDNRRRTADRDLEAQSLVYFPQFVFGTQQSKDAAKAREEAEREAKRLADTASREAKRAADAAARESERVAKQQAALLEGLASLARKTQQEATQYARGDGSLTGLIDRIEAADKARLRSRETTGLADAVSAAENSIEARKQAAKAQAEAFNQAVLDRAQEIGFAIGGQANQRIVQLAAAVALGGDQLRQLRGPEGVVARALSPVFQSDEFRKEFRPLVAQLKTVFGDRPFAQQLESAQLGAASASLVGNNSPQQQIGGAIGGVVGKEVGSAIGKQLGGLAGQFAGPLGAIAGGLLGSVVGGLFRRTRSGSVSIAGSGGQINQGAAIGNGGQEARNASILGNNFTNTLGSVVERLGGSFGDFAVSIGQRGSKFRVDPTGAGRTRGRGVLDFGKDSDAALQAALADAIRDGAVSGVSPRVQSVLRQYADNLDRAVADALKVQNLENFLSDRDNPFGRAFREFERQAADRLKIARQYGFDVVEIEKVNAEERAKLLKEQLADTTASAKALLDDLRFGSRAEGSASQRLAALGTERSRLEGLVAGGDTSQIDALTQIIQQQMDLSREAFGSTGPFAADRSGAISSLETLIRQTEERINAASAEARTVDKLTELNTTADEQMTELQRQTALLQQLALGGGLAAFNIAAFARPLA